MASGKKSGYDTALAFLMEVQALVMAQRVFERAAIETLRSEAEGDRSDRRSGPMERMMECLEPLAREGGVEQLIEVFTAGREALTTGVLAQSHSVTVEEFAAHFRDLGWWPARIDPAAQLGHSVAETLLYLLEVKAIVEAQREADEAHAIGQGEATQRVINAEARVDRLMEGIGTPGGIEGLLAAFKTEWLPTRRHSEQLMLAKEQAAEGEACMAIVARELGGPVADAKDVEEAFRDARSLAGAGDKSLKAKQNMQSCRTGTLGSALLIAERERELDAGISRIADRREVEDAVEAAKAARASHSGMGAWLYFGNRFPYTEPTAGERYRLRYEVMDGHLRYNAEDHEAIGDALVALTMACEAFGCTPEELRAKAAP